MAASTLERYRLRLNWGFPRRPCFRFKMLAGVEVSHAWEPRILWTFEILAAFTTNAAGSAIVNAIGPIRQIVQGGADAARRYLVIAPAAAGKPVQIQAR